MGPDGVTVDGEPLIFFHYMGLQALHRRDRRGSPSGRFRITADERRWIYDPYVERSPRSAAGSRRSSRTTRVRSKPQPGLGARGGDLGLEGDRGRRARCGSALPHTWNVGPYVPGGYVPARLPATAAAVEATYSTSASESSG